MSRSRTSRHLIAWLTVPMGVLAAGVWAMHGFEAMTMAREPSPKAIFACAAFGCVGIVIGAALWAFPGYRRQMRSTHDSHAAFEPSHLLFSGLIGLGAGASVILDPTPEVHEWGLLVLGSLVGGVAIGVSFLVAVDHAARRSLDTQIPNQ